jgi:hypothetical protein
MLPNISGGTFEAHGTIVSCRAEQGGSDIIHQVHTPHSHTLNSGQAKIQFCYSLEF